MIVREEIAETLHKQALAGFVYFALQNRLYRFC